MLNADNYTRYSLINVDEDTLDILSDSDINALNAEFPIGYILDSDNARAQGYHCGVDQLIERRDDFTIINSTHPHRPLYVADWVNDISIIARGLNALLLPSHIFDVEVVEDHPQYIITHQAPFIVDDDEAQQHLCSIIADLVFERGLD
jgi:hypothetical protein